MTVLWLTTLVAACILVALAILARKIPRRGPRRMLLPAWTLIGSLFGGYWLFFACADDVYGVYRWILSLISVDESRDGFSQSANAWRVEASRRDFIAVALAMRAVGVIALATLGLSRASRGALCMRCLYRLLPGQSICPECGLVREAQECSRLDAICARSPALGFVVELTGVLPFIGFFIALAVAFVPIPRKHDYEDFQQIQLPSVNGSMEFMHVVIGNSIERA